MDEMNSNAEQKIQSVPSTKFCPHCGKSLPPDALFCGGCGIRLDGTPAPAAAPVAPALDIAPLQTKDYLLMLLLLCIPLAGIIVYCIWAFSGDTNINRRNFCRAYLIYYAIAMGFVVLVYVALFAILAVLGVTMTEIATSSYAAILPFLL